MNRITITLELPNGDVYLIRSGLCPRDLFAYLTRSMNEQNVNDDWLFDEIAKVVQPEWKLPETEYVNDNWGSVPPAVVSSWLKKILEVSGQVVEAKVVSEKK